MISIALKALLIVEGVWALAILALVGVAIARRSAALKRRAEAGAIRPAVPDHFKAGVDHPSQDLTFGSALRSIRASRRIWLDSGNGRAHTRVCFCWRWHS